MHGLIRFIIFLDKIHKITSSQDLFFFLICLLGFVCFLICLFFVVVVTSSGFLFLSPAHTRTHYQSLPLQPLMVKTVEHLSSKTKVVTAQLLSRTDRIGTCADMTFFVGLKVLDVVHIPDRWYYR